MTPTPTPAALFGGIATAIAILGGGLAVEACTRRRDRMGMALAPARAIDALIGLIETRRMTAGLWMALAELDAGRPVEFGALIGDNAPFQAITLSHAGQPGNSGGDLPRVARVLTFSQGLTHDLVRLDGNKDKPVMQAMPIRTMKPLREQTGMPGVTLVMDLRHVAGRRRMRWCRMTGASPDRAANAASAVRARKRPAG